ncbi:MAG: hypothetical protein AB9856_02750 [Cellulosilyticaceae bacterium]
MTKTELKQNLVRKNIPVDSYSLEGGLPNEVYCLGKNERIWEVYYSERGQKTSLEIFLTEDAACEFFYNWLEKSLNCKSDI